MYIYFELLIIVYYKSTLFIYELCGSVLFYPHHHTVWMRGWPFCLNYATMPSTLLNCLISQQNTSYPS